MTHLRCNLYNGIYHWSLKWDFHLNHLQWREWILVFPQLSLCTLQPGPLLHRFVFCVYLLWTPLQPSTRPQFNLKTKVNSCGMHILQLFSKAGTENWKIILLLIWSPSLVYTEIKEISNNKLTHMHSRTSMGVHLTILYNIPTLSVFF